MRNERTVIMKREWWRSRWWMPAFCLFLGALILGAYAIGDNAGEGLVGFGVMAAVAAVFWFGGRRSETLGGEKRDEFWASLDLRATAFAGTAALLTVIGCWLYELSQGDDGSPYSQIMAVAGVSYILAVAFLRWRS
jgi:hypothetical protein